MRQDATKRVRSAITSVMNQYGVRYQDVRRSNHPGIMFTVHGQTRTITYGGGDPRAHMNARTQARRVLAELGVVPNQQDDTLVDDITPPVAEGSLSMMDNDRSLSMMDNDPGPVPIEAASHEAASHETSSPDHTAPTDPPPESSPEPLIEPSDPAAPSEAPRYGDAGYVLFTPTKYNSPQVRLSQGRFFAIELDRDLIAAKGTYLVIPVDIQDTVWDMPPHEFRCCFTPIIEQAVTEKQTVAEVEREPAPDAKPLEMVKEPEPSEDIDKPAQFPRSAEPSSEPKRVSPQMGRVLLVMHFLHQQGEIEITGHAIQALLSPVDAKQISGMLSGAIKLRYVTRGGALEAGRGTRYKLSPAGRMLAQSLGTWPYDHRGLAVPPWLRESMRMHA
jgi:hypothetical protein